MRSPLRLNPDYADAHFNLALIAERDSDNLRALKHWKAYLKLDDYQRVGGAGAQAAGAPAQADGGRVSRHAILKVLESYV